MWFRKLNETGFVPIIIIVGIVLALVGGVIYYEKGNGKLFSTPDESTENSPSIVLTPTPSIFSKSTFTSPSLSTVNSKGKSGSISTPTTPTPKPNTSSATSTPVQVQPTSVPTATTQPPTPTPSPSVTCQINVDKSSGSAPLTVTFVYGAYFYNTQGTDYQMDYVTNVQWDFNGDGNWDTSYDTSQQHPSPYTYSNSGSYTAKMHLQTNKGLESSVCTTSITVN